MQLKHAVWPERAKKCNIEIYRDIDIRETDR